MTNFSNIAVDTNFSTSITDIETSKDVDSAIGWPAAPFNLQVEDEVIRVRSKSGTTFSDMIRGYDGTTAASHTVTPTVRHAVIAEDISLLPSPVPAWMSHLADRTVGGETVHTDDDEFNDGIIDAAWTIVQPTGTQDIVEKDDVMSIRPLTTFTSADIAAHMKAVPTSFPLSIEVAARILSSTDANDYMMLGAILSDGVATTSNLTMLMTFPNSGVQTVDNREGTFTAVVAGLSNLLLSVSQVSQGAVWYYRIIWVASNSFKVGFSPDRATWKYSNAYSKTFTPTHMGFGWSTWGNAPNGERWLTMEYFRVTESDLSL